MTQTDKHVCPNWKSVCTWCGAENPPAAWRASQAPTVSQTVSPEERARPILEYFASLPINTRILGEMIIKVIRDDRAAILHNGTQNGDVSAIYQASHALGCYIDKAEYQCCVPKCPSRQARPERKDGKCPSCGEHRADYPATSPKELTKSDNSGKGEA